jgi:hypothetical protein
MDKAEFEKLLGRVSAIELILVIRQIQSLRGANALEIAEAAKSQAQFWIDIGDALESDLPEVISVARTESLKRLGDLMVMMAGPVAEEIERKLRDGEI